LDEKGKKLFLQPEVAQRLIALRYSSQVQAVLKSKKPLDWIAFVLAFKSQIPSGRTDSKRQYLNTLMMTMHGRYMGIPHKSSLDIIIAVARQWEFTAKMVEINWTTAESVADAVARYKKFLLLMKDHPSSILVPILSIDLAWHTHMLNHYNYREYTLKYLFLVVNHDDTITSSKVNNYLISTAKLWYKKYQEPYTTDDLEKLYSSNSLFAAMQKKKLRKYWYQNKATGKKEPTVE
jgi:Glycine-rich domain-containing protein-like